MLHVFALPLIAILFIFVHYYKVVRHGHSLPPELEQVGEDTARKVSQDKRVPFLPDVFTNELVWFGILMVALVVPVALNIYNAPLEHAANPSSTPLHTVAPWYFLFIQGWLKLGDKTFWGVIFPTILVGLLLLWPYLDYNPSRRYGDRRIALAAMFVVIAIMVISSYMGTPGFAVTTAPQIEIGHEFMPGEQVGPIRAIPFDQMLVGTWRTDELESIPDDAPQLRTGDGGIGGHHRGGAAGAGYQRAGSPLHQHVWRVDDQRCADQRRRAGIEGTDPGYSLG